MRNMLSRLQEVTRQSVSSVGAKANATSCISNLAYTAASAVYVQQLVGT